MNLKFDDDHRLHIDSPLVAESLMNKSLINSTEINQVFKPLLDLNVIKLGGHNVKS